MATTAMGTAPLFPSHHDDAQAPRTPREVPMKRTIYPETILIALLLAAAIAIAVSGVTRGSPINLF